MKRIVLLAFLLLCAFPLRGEAQAGSCVLVDSRTFNRQESGGFATVSVAGPLRVECTGGTTLRADSAVVYEGSNEVHLFGRVDYRDPTRTLTSDYATYSSTMGRLYATGNVVFTDVMRGSTLRGPELEYFRAMEGRPQPQAIAQQRPHLTVVPKDASAGNREPLQIDADRITSVGDNHFSASGSVVVHRSDLDATASEAFHDAQQETLQLRGNARIRGERFDMAGETIEATLPAGKIDQAVARDRAELVSEKLRVDGPEIRLFFKDDLLQRLVTRRGTEQGGERPLVTAAEFRMEADSLEAVLPGQKLERVIAIGNAHGETIDTTAEGAPRPETQGKRTRLARAGRPAPDILARDRDWVVGDTLIGYFVPVDSARRATARADSAAAPQDEVELDRVLAKGAARSLYRVREEGKPPAERPALNYLAGDEIEMELQEGELDVAQVRGLKRGLYLDPARPAANRPPAPGAEPGAEGTPAPAPAPPRRGPR
jgi:lipopolysaccharide export system protein LptA